MKQPLGIILAGGRATRMGGGDKGLLPLGAGTLISHVIDRIAPQVASVALNANGDPARFSAFGLPVLPDPVEGFVGPLAGVLAGLDWAAAQGAETVVSVAADTPFFPCDLVPRLMLAADGMDAPLALSATPDGRQPTFGIWPVALRNDLRTALQDGLRKVVMWTEQHGAQTALFEECGDPFFNVNTPADLNRARTMLEGAT
ncbi:molybdenum cofactor guanylyltransferase MobA [Pseudohalocynthiibacter aestuariivivens]|uniref:Molybdenum cofactor guanylyltransferase n=1 Tax=Roseovarius pelagicus TaxID=2980108 RepID=A0ABY6DEK5_9RHOB|nr:MULTISPECIES: molybdenum cofactor guanylyltransferase MobA [Rhodobacterales]QIE46893.1 molybdenum cofactor guanylyltransferase MobA [Pseudohalocynthiibacter aestuariivivens]UXX84561.1 molybdenum cofactor guanylyltransferase MobA [Roseovarius pelagicus]